ncbi:radical SAM protein [Saccharothrix syringae]|uniref:Radical SAM protein n=1 Tax=Saccharothrix syringae TaxID=103733 RepID=A0A5Q0GQI8_SACSY|nr:radical SAM protein [Saccharothrix syringae]QFZ16218.1 radical SAM protein [Saccharothrix syringae]
MSIPVHIRNATANRRLAEWQVRLVEELEQPRWSADGRSGSNVGEDDVTIRRHEGRTWIYKTWESTRVPGLFSLYAPATGRVHRVTAGQAALLRRESWTAADQPGLAALEALVQPFEAPGWRFPTVPEEVRADGPPRVRVLMLNPTEQCNIRCTYCYYGGAYPGTRPHQTASPSADFVEAAIDLFVTGEDRLADAHRAVYFFGGEPLMAFRQLRDAYTRLEERIARTGAAMDNLVVQVNTNGMLLNEEIVEFLVAKGIYLNVSVDGPNHDRYRVDRRGRGTLDRVRERVDWLAAAQPEYFANRVAIICVLSSPLDPAGLYRFFAEWPAARQALAWDFDLLLPGGEESYTEFEEMFAAQDRIWDLFVDAHELPHAEREASGRYRFAFSCGFLHRSFHRALNSPGRDGGPDLGHLLGVQLVPGTEYLVLGSDGTLYSSYEYQSPAFEVGHASRGIDLDAGLAQLRMFRDAVQASSCGTCWAAPLCTVTVPESPFRATDSPDEVRAKVAGKRARCRSERRNLAQALRARVDIEALHADEALAGHRDDWDRQKEGGSRVDHFYL